MNEIEMKSRKGQIHRTWSRKLIDEIKEKVEKYDELMNVETVWNFIDFLESIDKKIKETKKDKTFEMMIGRYKKLSEEDFKKMIERQVSAFKASMEKSEEDELEEILNEIA